MQTFDLVRPAALDDAVSTLTRHGDQARVLAGGTDLVVALRHRTTAPRVVVDLKTVTDLSDGVRTPAGQVLVGATQVMTEVAEQDEVRRHFPSLIEAMDVVGSLQIRNRATLGGNICNASPAADTVPTLLTLDAIVHLVGPHGRQSLPLNHFLLGPRETALRRGEVVVALTLTVPQRPTGTAFARMTRRRGVDLATVNLSCSVDDAGRVRLAYGAVGPRAFLVEDTSGALADPSTPASTRDNVLDTLISRAAPITDIRGSREYRLAMLRVLTLRALGRASRRLATATEDQP